MNKSDEIEDSVKRRKMKEELDAILDDCIDRMKAGESLEDCLASYSEYAQDLEPLLRTVSGFGDAHIPVPRPAPKATARQRFQAESVRLNQAMAKPRRGLAPHRNWSCYPPADYRDQRRSLLCAGDF